MKAVESDEINCAEDFERKYNYRLAERCCANCKHGENGYEGCATCRHPERFDFGRHNDFRIRAYNVNQSDVCDAWEKSEGGVE